MRGSVTKKNGSYYVVLDVGRDPQSGKRKKKWFSVKKESGKRKPNKQDAEDVLLQKLQEFKTGTLVDPSDMTFSDFLNKWVKNYVENELKQTTRDVYKNCIQAYIKPSLGKIKISEIKPFHLQEFYTEMLESLAPGTIQKCHNIIRKSLKHAVAWEMIKKNPAENVSPPRDNDNEMIIWTEEEAGKFLEEVKNHRYYPLYYLALETGLRRGEILGLKWNNVDLQNRVIYVRESLVLSNGKLIHQSVKSDSSKRSVALGKSIAEMLKFHRKKQQKELEVFQKDTENYVFLSQEGSPVYPSSLRRHFNNTIQKLGISKIRFHDLRHYHATNLLEKGVHPKIVQERLGHSSIKITLDLYSHVSMNMQKDVIDRLEEEKEQKNLPPNN